MKSLGQILISTVFLLSALSNICFSRDASVPTNVFSAESFVGAIRKNDGIREAYGVCRHTGGNETGPLTKQALEEFLPKYSNEALASKYAVEGVIAFWTADKGLVVFKPGSGSEKGTLVPRSFANVVGTDEKMAQIGFPVFCAPGIKPPPDPMGDLFVAIQRKNQDNTRSPASIGEAPDVEYGKPLPTPNVDELAGRGDSSGFPSEK